MYSITTRDQFVQKNIKLKKFDQIKTTCKEVKGVIYALQKKFDKA